MILVDKINFKADQKGRQYFTDVRELLINFAAPIVLIIASVGVFALYILPTYKGLPGLKEQIDAETQEIAALQAKVDQLNSLQQNKSLVMQDLVKMSWALEERDKVPELTEQVRLMSRDSNVAFTSLDYDNASDDETGAAEVAEQSDSLTPDPALYREEKVDVTLGVGGASSVVSFLRTAESSIRLFKVESLRITARNEGNTADLVMASPYLNPAFSTYSETSATINLTDSVYRNFMEKLDTFKNYAQTIDAALPKI